MSYDIAIAAFDANYTSNVSAVFYDHFPNGSGIMGLDGMTGSQCAAEFEGFWRSMHSAKMAVWSCGTVGEPHLSEKYDVPNGWGSLIGALILIGQFQAACAQHPRHRVRVSA